ncbi:WbqC-like protein family protein [Streptomyces sp. DvalAA-14]|uniref:WbqC family protein n=1 Tax=unclassified Streptomyces TaxID=2593676 RepID=UPI00081BC3AC|nr:WbqC family protein [Streptomyces sp. DvalAA-14]SCE11681.1 WbqC-like protein family protein [Streptomyces sp. DvalAA-14]
MCAIHQPNFLPRLGTLAKLFAADYWIVLDDVQFTRRDYQHRARIAPLDRPDLAHWLSLATHLPDGRSTLIRDARLADPQRSRDRTAQAIRHCYRRSRHWQQVSTVLDQVLEGFTGSDRTGVVAENSTRVLLDLLGWRGEIIRSSQLQARRERSQRLSDLAAVTGATTYLCGPGGLRYVDHAPFEAADVLVEPFLTPADGLWSNSRRLSALHTLSELGATGLASGLAETTVLTGIPDS